MIFNRSILLTKLNSSVTAEKRLDKIGESRGYDTRFFRGRPIAERHPRI